MIASIADLVAFLKNFHRHWLADPSLAADVIPNDLPAGLATIYRELGALIEIAPEPENNRNAPFSTQDSLWPVSLLKRVDDMSEFACENQGNWTARCPVGQADPPVYSDAADVWNEPPRGFIVVCTSLNHFLTTLCLQEAVMGCRHLAALRTDRPLEQALTVPLEALWLNGCYVNGTPDHHFFVSPERDVLVMDWAGMWVGSLVRPIAEFVAPGEDVRVLH